MFVNNCKSGRFGNEFFRNMILYILYEINNIKCEYENIQNFKQIGIEFNSNSILDTNNTNIKIKDNDIIKFLDNEQFIDLSCNYIFKSYCQSKRFIKHIIKYYQNLNNNLCKNIISNNKFNNRYNNNNDVFIHIRAADIFQGHPPVIPTEEYFEYVLNELNQLKDISTIYLSSDKISDNLCQNLIKKYNITIYNSNKFDTILFGSTCKYIILSSGSYSFMIGLFAFYSKCIYFSKYAGHHQEYFSELLAYPKYKMIELGYI